MTSADDKSLQNLGEEFVDELKPGTELLQGQYTIERFINAGGFGITYLARNSLDRKVVIKECFPGSFCRRSRLIVQARSRTHQNELSSIVQLFVQEARSLAKLEHPNIVGVHQVFEDNNTAYMALDFVEGRDMLDIIEDPAWRIDPPRIKEILRRILQAVAFIHKEGMLHRDISPDNILVDQDGNPILIDFGAAREQASKKSRVLSAMRVVKDGYSPQEFYIAGAAQGPHSDLYALGATFYHIVSGEVPPNSQARLSAAAQGDADPYEPLVERQLGFDKPFLASIDKALAVLPKDRMQSAEDWLMAIDGHKPKKVADPSDAVLAASATLSDYGGSSDGAAAEQKKGKGGLIVVLMGSVAAAGAAVVFGMPLLNGDATTVAADTSFEAPVTAAIAPPKDPKPASPAPQLPAAQIETVQEAPEVEAAPQTVPETVVATDETSAPDVPETATVVAEVTDPEATAPETTVADVTAPEAIAEIAEAEQTPVSTPSQPAKTELAAVTPDQDATAPAAVAEISTETPSVADSAAALDRVATETAEAPRGVADATVAASDAASAAVPPKPITATAQGRRDAVATDDARPVRQADVATASEASSVAQVTSTVVAAGQPAQGPSTVAADSRAAAPDTVELAAEVVVPVAPHHPIAPDWSFLVADAPNPTETRDTPAATSSGRGAAVRTAVQARVARPTTASGENAADLAQARASNDRIASASASQRPDLPSAAREALRRSLAASAGQGPASNVADVARAADRAVRRPVANRAPEAETTGSTLIVGTPSGPAAVAAAATGLPRVRAEATQSAVGRDQSDALAQVSAPSLSPSAVFEARRDRALPAFLKPEVPEQGAPTAPIVSVWNVVLPFTAASDNPTAIGEITGSVPSWMRAGSIVKAINGIEIKRIADIPEILRISVSMSGQRALPLTFTVLPSPGADPVEGTLFLPVVQDTMLISGARFRTVFADGAWRTAVTSAPVSGSENLQVGDILMTYMATNEQIDDRDTLGRILQREFDAGAERLTFAVRADDSLWVRSMAFDRALSN